MRPVGGVCPKTPGPVSRPARTSAFRLWPGSCCAAPSVGATPCNHRVGSCATEGQLATTSPVCASMAKSASVVAPSELLVSTKLGEPPPRPACTTMLPACGSASTGVLPASAALTSDPYASASFGPPTTHVRRSRPRRAPVARRRAPDARDEARARRGSAEERVERAVRQRDQTRLTGLPTRQRLHLEPRLAGRADRERRKAAERTAGEGLIDEVERAVCGARHGDGGRGRRVRGREPLERRGRPCLALACARGDYDRDGERHGHRGGLRCALHVLVPPCARDVGLARIRANGSSAPPTMRSSISPVACSLTPGQ